MKQYKTSIVASALIHLIVLLLLYLVKVTPNESNTQKYISLNVIRTIEETPPVDTEIIQPIPEKITPVPSIPVEAPVLSNEVVTENAIVIDDSLDNISDPLDLLKRNDLKHERFESKISTEEILKYFYELDDIYKINSYRDFMTSDFNFEQYQEYIDSLNFNNKILASLMPSQKDIENARQESNATLGEYNNKYMNPVAAGAEVSFDAIQSIKSAYNGLKNFRQRKYRNVVYKDELTIPEVNVLKVLWKSGGLEQSKISIVFDPRILENYDDLDGILSDLLRRNIITRTKLNGKFVYTAKSSQKEILKYYIEKRESLRENNANTNGETIAYIDQIINLLQTQ